ncbi:MAG: RsiV family protein [Eubacteriales bacterium]|nr:RsiV family protein [Eubacteriales bacterium]
MKRTIAAAMAAICMLTAAGCSRSESMGECTVEETEAQEQTGAAAGETEAQEQTDAEAANGLSLTFTTEERDWYNEDKTRWLLHGEYTSVRIGGEGYEAAAEKIGAWSEADEENFWKAADESSSDGEQVSLWDEEGGTDYYACSMYQTLESARADRQVISLVAMSSSYLGGAHGSYGYTGYTFDASTGELLDIEDLMTDAETFRQTATEAIVQKLQETYGDGLFEDYADTVAQIWSRDGGPKWYLNETGIVFLFDPYEVGPYAMGAAQVTLPYADYRADLAEQYTSPESAGEGFGKISAGTATVVTAGDDAKLSVYLEAEDEYGGGPLTVELGDQKLAGERFDRLTDVYLIRTADGRAYALTTADYASEDYVTNVFDVTEGRLLQTDSLSNAAISDTGVGNTELLSLRVSLNVLGSYTSRMDYQLNEEGKMVRQSELYQIDMVNGQYRKITTAREIPVTVDGEPGTLAAGTEICITATDNDGTAVYEDTATGETGEIHYTKGDGDNAWTLYIDGVSEYDCFDELPYAG